MINQGLTEQVAKLQKHNKLQVKGFSELDISEDILGQVRVIQADIAEQKKQYQEMATWKQMHGNKYNASMHKQMVQVQKQNQELKK